MTDLLESLNYEFDSRKTETLSLGEYLDKASKDKAYYLNAAERMLKAIGEPALVDTSKDTRLGKIFSNKMIKTYPVFTNFYGMEETISKIVSYFTHASQGLEESKQILYLLGGVGGGKSSLAEKLKTLMEKEPFYAIKDSPVFDNPLSLFDESFSEKLNIPAQYFVTKPSPWLIKKLDELNGDISKLRVVKLYPNQTRRIAITKTEPGDDNNQDIATLVGKINIRKIEDFDQNDVGSYLFSGGLCRGNRGILEFVEMFKAPIKMLHPLLTATQEHNYNGTQEIGAIPFEGIILAHSNESEWHTFKNNKNNEAFIDRVYVVDVPYCLRVTEEQKILEKLIKNSSLAASPIAPHTLQFLAKFNVMTRLSSPADGSLYTKMRVYNGESVKDKVPNSKSLLEYKGTADKTEGFVGFGTRCGYKVLARTFNYDFDEIAANPIHLQICLQDYIDESKYPDDITKAYKANIEKLQVEYAKELSKDIQRSYLDNENEFAQNVFERYHKYAEAWIEDADYRHPETGLTYSRDQLNKEMEKIEKPLNVGDPKDFRNAVVHFVNRYRAENKGSYPKWTSYEKMRQVIEAQVFSNMENLLPVISFDGQTNKETADKHKTFVGNMKKLGYTERQIRYVVEWYNRYASKG